MTSLSPHDTDATPVLPEDGVSASVPARVARAIQAMIADEGLEEGDALPSQRDLAGILGASRPSVREAISMLEALGLVRVEQRRGLFVAAASGLQPADLWSHGTGYSLEETYQFRMAMEPQVLRLAMPAITGDVKWRLWRSVEALMAAARTGRSVEAAEQDTLFHDLIVEACGNRIFQSMHRQMAREFQSSQWVPMVRMESMVETAAEHLAIMEAVDRLDRDAACRAMAAHIQGAARRAGIDLTS